jgi:hypothetical protein
LNRKLGAALVIVLIGYVALMLCQEYHTIADVLTTALVIVPLTLAIHLLGSTAERRRQLTTAR